MLDRREFVTGLAAVAVAPAMHAPADPDARYKAVRRDCWHFQEATIRQLAIRHVPTGLTFVSRPTEADRYAVALADPPPMDTRELALIRNAARCISLHAVLVVGCRPEHKGAVYFRYRPDADPAHPYYAPITTDAPSLSEYLRYDRA